ncbi:NADH-quinone oxidoreductase subunit C [Streptomyces sp. NPDC001568]|uniref:NADH-quinone oxidoreductase subunit C n=1 Tax=Streptomyces sp. NPDC001568 TaxID=3364588 RepID=UPI0036C554DA
MNLYDSLPDAAPAVFGAEAVASYAYEVLTVDVPVGSWIPALEIARDKLGCTYFDWLSAVDEPGTGFRICAHLVCLENHRVRRLLLRTTVPHGAPSLPSAVAVYAGAEWHERETFEMFGVTFTDHPHLVPLLLPENFEGHPLRKDFVLAARVAKAWPGAKEPGEGHDPDAPKRRQMLPPGVPDPNDWGPLKGQLPPAPTRPARTPRAGAPTRTPREGAPARRPRPGAAPGTPETPLPPESDAPVRPARRTRSVADGSASQAAAEAAASPESAPASSPESDAPVRPARRTRSVADGSASQAAAEAAPSPDSEAPPRSAPEGASAPDTETPTRPPRRTRSAADGSTGQAAPPGAEPARRPAPRSADAPWHDPKPAFEDAAAPAAGAGPTSDEPGPKGAPEPEPDPATGTKPEAVPKPEAAPKPKPDPEPAPDPDPAPGTDPAPEPEPGQGNGNPDHDTTGGDA